MVKQSNSRAIGLKGVVKKGGKKGDEKGDEREVKRDKCVVTNKKRMVKKMG